MPAPSALHDLIDRFHDNLDDYRSGRYKETPLRDDFLDPLFELLGWDMRNAAGLNEMNREVVKEDRLEVEGKIKAPDYSFRIGAKRKFFVEAKKQSVSA